MFSIRTAFVTSAMLPVLVVATFAEPAWCQSPLPVIGIAPPIDNEQNPHAAHFIERDTDADGMLNETEYVIGAGRDRNIVRREFKVFDADGDLHLSLNEFLTVPVGQPEDQRGVIDDPIIQLAAQRLAELMKPWEQWDIDGDGSLNKSEFQAAKPGSLVPGLQSAGFMHWDQDVDGNISREDVCRTLEIAYGVRTAGGAMLRNNAGLVVDWLTFSRLKISDDGMVSKADYFEALGDIEDKDGWLNSIDKNHDDRFDFSEFSTGNHRTDPVGSFLSLDKDLDGLLTLQELEPLPVHWREMATFAFKGFDDDHDRAISLREYQFMPHCNLLAAWTETVDTNNDGKLLQFRFSNGVFLSALAAEYFHRLDVNDDKAITTDEFKFITAYKPPTELRVQTSDGTSKIIVIPGYEVVCSPEISSDNKWVAVDAWSRGESNTAAHIIFVNLETDEIRDLGIGCMPNWSADGKRFAYCRYGQGVFIRDFEGDGEDEESIDPQGWAIQFSKDGLHTAYVKHGNLIIHDVATGTKRNVFAAGASPYRYIEHNIAWSWDSAKICFRGHRGNGEVEIGIVSAEGNDANLEVRCDAQRIQPDFTWYPDGKRLMFPMHFEGQVVQIFEVDPSGNDPPVRYPDQPADRSNGGLSWSRDGKLLVFVSTQ